VSDPVQERQMTGISSTPDQTDATSEKLPGMVYRSWFMFVLILVSASVVGERFMMAVMVGPIKAELKLSDTEIGLAKDMAIAIVYIIAVLPLARLADRWSKRKIIALSAGLWSIAVLICGAAKGFWMLLVGRALIGLGEGGYTPASQSWIADHFPLRQRATAMAIFLLGASLGNFLGPAVGGWLTHNYGWREAMFYAFLPGIVLAPIVWFTLRDVRPGLADNVSKADAEVQPFVATVKQLLAIRTLPLLMLSSALNTLITMGLVSWAPAFVERSHGMSAQDAGIQMGGALFLGSVIGHTVGGPLSDWLGRRDLRWYIWMGMLCGAAAMVIAWLALSAPMNLVFPLLGLNMLIGGMSAAPLLAVIAGLAPAHSRSVAVALLMIAINVIGLGLGPVFVGWLSDMLTPAYGQEALGMAMRIVLLVGGPSFVLAWLASRACLGDFDRAGGWSAGKPVAAALH
jgi:MFS family permease